MSITFGKVMYNFYDVSCMVYIILITIVLRGNNAAFHCHCWFLYSFYDGHVDMKMWAFLTVSDTLVTVKAREPLVKCVNRKTGSTSSKLGTGYFQIREWCLNIEKKKKMFDTLKENYVIMIIAFDVSSRICSDIIYNEDNVKFYQTFW